MMLRSTILLLSFSFVCTQDLFQDGFLSLPKPFNGSQDVVKEKWEYLEKTLSGVLEMLIKHALPTLVRTSGEAELSEECQSSFVQLIFGLKNLKSWAFRMLDATGKPPGGLLEGTLAALGSYDECLNIKVPNRNNPQYIDFQGKYCTMELRLPLPPKPEYLTIHFRNTFMQNDTNKESVFHDIYDLSHYFYLFSYRMGVCVPSTCSEADVLKLGTMITQRLTLELVVPRCEIAEPRTFSPAQIIIMSAFGFLFALVAFGTLAEVIYEKFLKDRPQEQPYERNLVMRVLSCFSLMTNVPKLFSPRTAVNASFLHGMRTISVCWLILGGVFMLINYQIIKQSSQAVRFSKSIILQAVLSHSLAVDTLFFTTAYVVGSRIAFRQKDVFKCWDFLKHLVHIVWRFTPVHMSVVALCILLPLLTRGPLWKETLLPLRDNCADYWWTNLFYINNIFPAVSNRCITNSWYLSAELQLFIIGLIFAAMWCTMKRNVGIILACGAVLVSIVTTGVVTSYFSYPPIALFSHVDLPARGRIEDAIQQKFYPHVPTWFAGLALGYYQTRKKSVHVKPYILAFGWVASLCCMTSVVFGIYEWNAQYWMNTHVSALYSAAHRPVWTLCISWLAFVCANGNAQTITSILSWSGFCILSRLSTLMILIHAVLLHVTVAHLRERLQGSSFMSIFLFSGIILLSCLMSGVLFLVVELPSLELKKLLDNLFFSRSSIARKAREFSSNVASKITHFSGSTLSPCTEHDLEKSPRRFKKRDSCQPLNVEEILEKIEFENSKP